MTEEREVDRGPWSRAARLAGLPVAHVGRAALGFGRRVAGRPGEVVTAEVQRRTAQQVYAVLGELKGGAMKVGQAVSAMEAAFPADVPAPYLEALTRLQEAAPAMPSALVSDVLTNALGQRWRHRFRDFDLRPRAAASIGQVHRAELVDGREVAVKIQYPGAGRALVADLRNLERLAPLVRLGAPTIDPRALFSQLGDRLLEEIDYEREATVQRRFADAYRDDPDVRVPEVIDATREVLVMEWLDGTPLAHLIAEGSVEHRDRAGRVLVRFAASSPSRAGLLHGDPHPGNFRLGSDGRLGVLDFGSCEPMPGGWSPHVGRLLRAGTDRDASRLHHAAVGLGLLEPGDVEPDQLLGLVEPLLAPLRTDAFTFSRAWLRGYAKPVSDPRTVESKVQRKLRVPVRHLLVQRVAAGTLSVLCMLGATVGVRDEAARWIPGFE